MLSYFVELIEWTRGYAVTAGARFILSGECVFVFRAFQPTTETAHPENSSVRTGKGGTGRIVDSNYMPFRGIEGGEAHSFRRSVDGCRAYTSKIILFGSGELLCCRTAGRTRREHICLGGV